MEHRLRTRMQYGRLLVLSHLTITVTLEVHILIVQMKKLKFKESQDQQISA